MCNWKEIGEKWVRAQKMGYQAVLAAIEVGEELQRKKLETPKGEWGDNLKHALNRPQASANVVASQLLRLALHRDLIEGNKPESMRGALALLPKVPRKVSEKQIQIHKDELNEFEKFAKKTAKDQAEILAKKRIKVELERLQNQAHAAVTTEMKALEKQLKAERARLSKHSLETLELENRYRDLVNRQFHGIDVKGILRTLKQATHPDRTEITPTLQKKAMTAIQQLEKFLRV